MAVKLAILVALFSLVLSAAAFASPVDVDLGSEAMGGTAGESEILVREHQDEAVEWELYLGPSDEVVAGREDRRVD